MSSVCSNKSLQLPNPSAMTSCESATGLRTSYRKSTGPYAMEYNQHRAHKEGCKMGRSGDAPTTATFPALYVLPAQDGAPVEYADAGVALRGGVLRASEVHAHAEKTLFPPTMARKFDGHDVNQSDSHVSLKDFTRKDFKP
ncbi:hypothetical protein B0H14DRAFT_2616380 [Mycena olivaceomarginata]|nr:hypothetical protein B0H14DRAFT_2616380 [Mycena olivaceomarginata]